MKRYRSVQPVFVYAPSNSTYGDHLGLPKIEETSGRPLSPYAVTKDVNELYSDVFARASEFHTLGLRDFNVFGQRQDPNSANAAVVQKLFAGLIKDAPVYTNGDGETRRDFCYIDNCVQANLLAALSSDTKSLNQVQCCLRRTHNLKRIHSTFSKQGDQGLPASKSNGTRIPRVPARRCPAFPGRYHQGE